jgi:cell division protein FtsW (lipid II flippase)
MFAKLTGRVYAAVVLLLMVAVVGRVAYELLRPLVPVLVVLVGLALVYVVAFGRLRK